MSRYITSTCILEVWVRCDVGGNIVSTDLSGGGSLIAKSVPGTSSGPRQTIFPGPSGSRQPLPPPRPTTNPHLPLPSGPPPAASLPSVAASARAYFTVQETLEPAPVEQMGGIFRCVSLSHSLQYSALSLGPCNQLIPLSLMNLFVSASLLVEL